MTQCMTGKRMIVPLLPGAQVSSVGDKQISQRLCLVDHMQHKERMCGNVLFCQRLQEASLKAINVLMT